MKEEQTEFSNHTYIIENTKKKNFSSLERMYSQEDYPEKGKLQYLHYEIP